MARTAAAADGAICLDCSTRLIGDYCHACGQSAHVHRTLAAWWHDFTHGVLHIEGTVWRTTAMLLLHPGQLTRRYIGGQRRRYLSLLALYLFFVFVLYIAYSVLGGFTETNAAASTSIADELTRHTATADAARSLHIATGWHWLDSQTACPLPVGDQGVLAIIRPGFGVGDRTHEKLLRSLKEGPDPN